MTKTNNVPNQSTLLRWVEVDLGAIAHNTRLVKQLLPPTTSFTAVVKSDAYGHGAAPVAEIALKSGADSLAVAYLDEAVHLRKAGIKAPLLVMGAILPSQADEIVQNRLDVMADSAELLKSLNHHAGPQKVRIHLKVNLGLNRWGFPLKDLPHFIGQIKHFPKLDLAGIFAHPGYMPGKNGDKTEEVIQNFLSAIKNLSLPDTIDIHVADSSILMDYPQFALSRVRVGNLVYGINPTSKKLDLKNPWRVVARVVHIEKIEAGASVGYGGEYVSPKSITVATVPAGYAHGLTLEPASRWIQVSHGQTYWGQIRGIKCPFVGRVGMGHCLIDVSDVKDIKIGDPVELYLRRTMSSNWQKIYKTP
ncbi:MAG TPA: alanine racemase [Elusimicrobiota bacterium]|nr:alanine racemase [Elusimicrobiota bacterium]